MPPSPTTNPQPPTTKSLLVTCEHGGNRVPSRYAPLFRGHESLLATHRGYDPGAASEVARAFTRLPPQASSLKPQAFYSTVTRLLIELNRSEHNPAIRSQFTRKLSPAEQNRVLDRYHRPYWKAVHDWIAGQTRHPVVHISSHTFTPVLSGVVRNADVGLLYDPRRPLERRLARLWKREIVARRPELRARFNYPYLGTSDGLTTALRRQFGAKQYVGIELELNQAWTTRDRSTWRQFYRVVIAAFSAAVASL